MPQKDKKTNWVLLWLIFTGLGLFLISHGWHILKYSAGSADELVGVVCVIIGFVLGWIGNTTLIG